MPLAHDTPLLQLENALRALRPLRGGATHLVSLYHPPARPLHLTVQALREERAQAANIRSKATRKNVLAALDALLARLRPYPHAPPHGLACFSGVAFDPDGTEHRVHLLLEPPAPLATYLYRCDARFHLDPLDALLHAGPVHGLLVLDRQEATLGLLRGGRIDLLAHHESRVPNKHSRGGQSAQRFERLIEEAASAWLRKVTDAASAAFQDVDVVLVGGPGMTKDQWLRDARLPPPLRARVLEPLFDVGYTNESGLRELARAARPALTARGASDAGAAVDAFLREVARDGLAEYGRDAVHAALSAGRVDRLLLSNAIPAADLDTWLAAAARAGTHVERIPADTDAGRVLHQGFAGVAALLRYRTPPSLSSSLP